MTLVDLHCIHVLILLSPCLFYGIFSATRDFEFWWCVYPALFFILLSILVQKYKWIFRYIAPAIIYILFELYRPRYVLPEIPRHSIKWVDCVFIYFPLCQSLHIINSKIREVLLIIKLGVQKYNLIRIILFAVLCIIHAFCFVGICSKLTDDITNLPEKLAPYLKSFKLYTDMTEVSVPQRQIHPDYTFLRSNDKLHSFEFVNPLDNRNIYLNGSHIVLNDHFRFPYCLETFQRITGEDVNLRCSFSINSFTLITDIGKFSTDIIVCGMKHEWRTNGRKLRQSYQYEMHNDCDIDHRKWNFRLKIRDLQQYHFDREISLWLSQKMKINNTELVIRIKAAKFFINRDTMDVSYVFVPLGHALHFKDIIVNLFSETGDIVIRQEIENFQNRKFDISNSCLDRYSGCNPLVWFFLTTFNFSPKLGIVQKDPYPFIFGSKSFESASCICENAYGIHTFSVQKFQYHSKNHSIIKEFPLPYKIIVLPIGLTSYSKESYHELAHDVLELLSKNMDWKRSWKFFKNDSWNSVTWSAIQYASLFCMHFDIIMVFIITIKIYNYLFIRKFAEQLLKQSSIPEDHIPANTLGNFRIQREIRYDIMIINADEDMRFVAKYILPSIRRRNLNVFVPFHDITPGYMEIQAYSDAVEASRTFVVIASQNLINDRFHNDCVLSTLIVPRVYNSSLHKANILVVKIENVEIPHMFWKHQRVLDWSKDSSGEQKICILNRELDTIFPSDLSLSCIIN